jgi:type II secretory pathway pseudopilin PulG
MPFCALIRLKLHRRVGFTIVELLVLTVILSILMCLLLPAVQSTRESARRVQCQNNLKQISAALFAFHDAKTSFPFGGWGHEWVGVPERGAKEKQPGGWIYVLLPNLGLEQLHNLGFGSQGSVGDEFYSQRLETPISLFVCPSRRPCATWPIAPQHVHVLNPKPFGKPRSTARSDYAISSGASNLYSFSGPPSIAQGDDGQFWRNSPAPVKFSGISHLRIGATLKSITDGTSKTYLVGEKYIDSNSYMTGTSLGDNESLYSGYCTDLHRFAGGIENAKHSLSPYAAPIHDRNIAENGIPAIARFGSAHLAGFNMVNCDGSIHFSSYDVDPEIHLRAGHRSDAGAPLASL